MQYDQSIRGPYQYQLKEIGNKNNVDAVEIHKLCKHTLL